MRVDSQSDLVVNLCQGKCVIEANVRHVDSLMHGSYKKFVLRG